MKRLRAAVAGLGLMGRHHVRILTARDDVELVAVIDPSADPSGIERDLPIVRNLEQALLRQLDCCVVAAPTKDHRDIAVALAREGVSALVEKPLAATVSQAREIAVAFERAGIPGCVGHVERCNPALLSLRTRIDDGALGELFQIATRRQGPFVERIRDVGVVKDLATHDIDLTSWIANTSYLAVAANVACIAGRSNEDLMAAIGWLKSGAVASHLTNWLTPAKERQIVVTGDRGCFVADTLANSLTFFENASTTQLHPEDYGEFRGVSEGDVVRYAISNAEPLAIEVDQFLRLVRGADVDVTSFDAGVSTIIVAEAMLAAAKTGKIVPIGA